MPPPSHFTFLRKGGNDHVIIPFPVPPSIKCGLCLLARGGGPWATEERQALARKHLREKHDGMAMIFKCSRCGDEFASLHGGRRHNPCRRSIAPSPNPPTLNAPTRSRLSVSPGAITTTTSTSTPTSRASVSPRSQVDPTFAPSYVSGNKLIMLYPGRPSRCPFEQCETSFTSFDTLSGAMSSMHRHLFEAHGVKASKFWRCSICGEEDTGLKMNGHYRRCLNSRPSTSPAHPSTRTDATNVGQETDEPSMACQLYGWLGSRRANIPP